MEPRQRTSPEQFSVLLDFMERHGDISRPQPGPQGRVRSEQLWDQVTTLLNSLGGGVQRSSDKWRKIWADWKTKSKKKYLKLKHQTNSTGGGPNNRHHLTALEERVVALIGVSAVVGQEDVAELGFNILSNETDVVNEIVLDLGDNSALGDHNQNVTCILNNCSPEPTTMRSPQATTSTAEQSPPLLTPPPVPTQPSHRFQEQTADSPRPSARTPRRPRRNRGITPFERVAREFAEVEQRRLAREEAIEMRRLAFEEARGIRLHEREMERIDVTRQHNQLLHQLTVIGQQLIDAITQQDPPRSLPSTDPI